MKLRVPRRVAGSTTKRDGVYRVQQGGLPRSQLVIPLADPDAFGETGTPA